MQIFLGRKFKKNENYDGYSIVQLKTPQTKFETHGTFNIQGGVPKKCNSNVREKN